jgi:DNA-binding response OmpR family regulator
MNNKILVVDDEKNIRTTLSTFLTSSGFEVELASDGEEALKKIKESDFLLVLLDIKMRGLNGMQVLEEMRKMGFKNNVVMMTAYGTIENAVESMKLGALDFLSKPFTLEDLKNIVSNSINRQKIEISMPMSFEDLIEYSKKCIIDKEFSKAKEYLKRAITENLDSPEPHNLLGILAEYEKDLSTARKHYRAALDLDPTYKPANENLERTSRLKYTKEIIRFDYNEDTEEK